MVETRSHKSSEGQKARLEVQVHPDPDMDENREGHEPERSGNRRLASESTPVEQGQDFATSTGTLDREERSELSDISTKNVATTRSPTDITMMHGVTEKPATTSSFPEEREGARRMTPHHKSEACRAEIKTLREYDMIELSKSSWACEVVMAKKKGGSLGSVATFVT